MLWLHLSDDVIIDIGFHCFDGDVVRGCASFLCSALLGVRHGMARRVRGFLLARVLELSADEAWAAELVAQAFLDALRRAHSGRVRRKTARLHRSLGGAPRGRRPGDARVQADKPTRLDIRLMRAGETCEMLMKERGEIVGCIQHFDACTHFMGSMSGQPENLTSSLHENLVCLTIAVQQAMAVLSADELRLIDLFGVQELTEREVAQELGLSQAAVHKQLWRLAQRIQQFWRLPDSVREIS
jgi:RNA polymerase sigma factor (sigma-70 family)